jgi:hypothetical protein
MAQLSEAWEVESVPPSAWTLEGEEEEEEEKRPMVCEDIRMYWQKRIRKVVEQNVQVRSAKSQQWTIYR